MWRRRTRNNREDLMRRMCASATRSFVRRVTGESAFHGGQEWKSLPTLVEDLSVTTNGLGPPAAAVAAASEAAKSVYHYPPYALGLSKHIPLPNNVFTLADQFCQRVSWQS